ncbi:MAG TPA: mannose-1-phosphate guanylyltransferase/mannose-6-phosphate isomerase [Sulfurospirillum sp. UBA12182]|nr:MAG TPA: mannose-1-phosphate guanylyltransferase/mannose-6-phosphate isomerase [Sulfurospirillum sp. UBA12182]
MTNIILCGGNGTRLWPMSRTLMPKQFIKLFSNKSLFQFTVERNSKICSSHLIVSNAEQYFLAKDQLEELDVINSRYLLEPIGRNTAPAIALACLFLDKNEMVLVTPSDHLIKDEDSYKKVVKRAQELASENYLVTFGIKPTFAEIGFGYIESDGENVKAFHEKPNVEKATEYLNAGNYYWNSGMFCFKVGVFLEELKKYSPQIYDKSLEAYKNAKQDNMIRIVYEDMLNIPIDSIDYAVMEKSNRVKVVASDISWSDVGSFDALCEELPNDANNNLIISEKPVHTIDIKDSIIVDTNDVLLVSKKGSTQKIKEIVTTLKKEKSTLTDTHLTGYRPWGTFTILEEQDGYKIKRIEVKPRKRLSLQRHKYRNEHWIVVSGQATVTIETNTFVLNQNESTYIKAGDIHRLSNNTEELLVIIEAQVGSYTGEDDIERLEDDFDRKE